MSTKVFLPGATLGVMGGGQLGRMFAIAARRMGYRVHSFSPDRDTPAGALSDLEVVARYDDRQAVEAFARGVDVLTFEFENVPVECARWASAFCEVRPSGSVLHICQQRLREKEFLAGAGIPLPPFARVESLPALEEALARIGTPAVLKRAAFGYDGKGQRKILPGDDPAAVWAEFEGALSVLEGFVPFEKEISVLVGRGVNGEWATYPVCENEHANHILDVTRVPAAIPPEVAGEARALAVRIADALDLVGLLAVEMFVLPGGRLLVNELAPRPHNSGHYSFDAGATSQFEQQVRAVCGLPLGATESLRPAAMANLLGDLWAEGEPNWAAALAIPEVRLHLYGKREPRPGRKMGHLVAFGDDSEQAARRVREARRQLTPNEWWDDGGGV